MCTGIPRPINLGLIETRAGDLCILEIAAKQPRACEIVTAKIAAGEIDAGKIPTTEMPMRIEPTEPKQLRKIICVRL